MGIVGMRRERWKHESDTDSHQNRHTEALPDRQLHHVHQLCDDRRQARSVDADINIVG